MTQWDDAGESVQKKKMGEDVKLVSQTSMDISLEALGKM